MRQIVKVRKKIRNESERKPSTALSKTTTLTCSSVSSAVMISFTCGSISGPKMLSGGWSNVTRQYSGERLSQTDLSSLCFRYTL